MPPRQGHHSVDEYLVAIHALMFPVGDYRPSDAAQPIAARVADRLGVSRAAAGEMLKRLTGLGLVRRGARHAILLTPSGIEHAERAIRSRRVLERFLTDYLGFDPGDVGERAAALAPSLPDEIVDAIHAQLGFPERCPHGWPVSVADDRSLVSSLRPLVELEAGARAEIACVTEDDAALHRWFTTEGLLPGARIEVRELQPAAGHLKLVTDDGAEHTVADKAARQLFVRVAG